MARQFTRLENIQYVPTTAGAIYANPASIKSYVKSLVLFNGHTAEETVQLYNVPDDGGTVGAAGGSNQFAKIKIQADETVMFDLPYPITLVDENDTIQASTTTANKVTVQVLGDIDA